MIAGCIVSQIYVRGVFLKMSSLANEFESMDKDGYERQYDTIHSAWLGYRTYLSLFTDHEHVNDIDIEMSLLHSGVKGGDSGEILSAALGVMTKVENLYENQKFTIENIL